MFGPHPLQEIQATASFHGADQTDFVELNTGTKQASRSRRSSLASLLATTTGLTTENPYQDKVSFRQLAKSYATRNLSKIRVVSDSGTGARIAAAGFSRSLRDDARSKPEGNYQTLTKKKAPLKELDPQNDSVPMAQEMVEISQTQVGGETQKTRSFGRFPIQHLSKTHIGLPNGSPSATVENTESCTVVLTTSESMPLHLTSILAQVAAGALQKIEITGPKDSLSWKGKALYLTFMEPEEASDFKMFAQTRLFLVNGVHPRVKFAEAPLNTNTDSKLVQKMMAEEGARRCLVLKRNRDPARSSLRSSASKMVLNQNDFDIDVVTRQFSQFGDIVEISGLLSRKLGFIVHYYDTASAIRAKASVTDANSNLGREYATWTCSFMKDPCERPCFAP